MEQRLVLLPQYHSGLVSNTLSHSPSYLRLAGFGQEQKRGASHSGVRFSAEADDSLELKLHERPLLAVSN